MPYGLQYSLEFSLNTAHDHIDIIGRRLLQLWTQRVSMQVQIGFSSRILAYINRSFDVREQLPQFYRCMNLASMAASAVELSSVLWL
jgi:hypothetical protein